MLLATTVLPTRGSGNTQRGPWPSPDLSTSAVQLSRRLGDDRDSQETPQSNGVLRGGLHETVCRVHLAPCGPVVGRAEHRQLSDVSVE